jgi:ATP-binding cassette subfamily F protein 3
MADFGETAFREGELDAPPLHFAAAEPLGGGWPLLQCDALAVGRERDAPLVLPFDLSIHPPDRIALVGVNGCGKSSVLATLAGQLVPLHGEVSTAPKLRVCYFAQHQTDALPPDALAHLRNLYPGETAHRLRGFLGSFGLKAQAVRPISRLSGGDKTRCALAAATFRPPHVLLLDEPTNHLDLGTVEAMGRGLRGFCGAVVLVSHDSRLIEELEMRVCWIERAHMHFADRHGADGLKSFLTSVSEGLSRAPGERAEQPY